MIMQWLAKRLGELLARAQQRQRARAMALAGKRCCAIEDIKLEASAQVPADDRPAKVLAKSEKRGSTLGA